MPLPNQDATQVVTNNGLRTQYGVIIPPGAKVAAFVRSTGIQDDGNDAFLVQNLVTTLAAGLARARSGKGDFVVCLPGHTENVADGTTFSNALVAGTKIIGVGRGSNTPTFTWTATGGQWLVNKADVQIAGLRLLIGNAVPTAIGIQVTAADFGFNYNDVVVSTSTSQVVRAIQLAAGADRADLSGNIFRGFATSATTLAIDLPAVVADVRFCDNEVVFAAGGNGLINIAAASTGLKILRNTLSNTLAGSAVAIVYANVAITGQCAFNTISVLNNTTITQGTTGITVGGTNNLTGYFNNYTVNSPNASGLLTPAVDT